MRGSRRRLRVDLERRPRSKHIVGYNSPEPAHPNPDKPVTHPTDRTAHAYKAAQSAMAILKAAVYQVLLEAGTGGMKNVEVGKALGIHAGHVRHEGHIPRTLLAIMEGEGVTEQDPATKSWRLKET